MMDDFGFDERKKPGTNQIVRHNGCATCDGHRMVQVTEEPEAWARCPTCNPAPAVTDPGDYGARGKWWEE